MNSCNTIVINCIDTLCKSTCLNSFKGESVIDYIILHDNLFEVEEQTVSAKYVKDSFKVWEEGLTVISDHRLITCNLEISPGKRQSEIMNTQKIQAKTGKIQGWRRRDNGDHKYWDKLQ